jgi:hypothetical protein
MKLSTTLLIAATICSLPILSDQVTTKIYPEAFYACGISMIVLFIAGMFFSGTGDEKEV